MALYLYVFMCGSVVWNLLVNSFSKNTNLFVDLPILKNKFVTIYNCMQIQLLELLLTI